MSGDNLSPAPAISIQCDWDEVVR